MLDRKPLFTTLSIRLTVEDRKRLRVLSAHEGKSASELVRELIRQRLQEKGLYRR